MPTPVPTAVPTSVPTAVPTAEPTAVPTAAPAPARPNVTAPPQLPELGARYDCVNVVMTGGVEIDPTALGGVTSFTLYDGHSASFALTGKQLSGVTWHEDGGACVLVYPENEMLRLEPTDDGGFQFVYKNMMTMVFKKAE